MHPVLDALFFSCTPKVTQGAIEKMYDEATNCNFLDTVCYV